MKAALNELSCFSHSRMMSARKLNFSNANMEQAGACPAFRTHATAKNGTIQRGIQLRKNGCQNVTLGWNKVAERIDTLIRNGRYTRLKEKNQRKRFG